MADSIVYQVRASSTSPAFSGRPSWSTAAPTTYTARWVRQPSVVSQNDGSVIEVESYAWIKSTVMLSPRARYTLPDGSTPPVVAVEGYPDQDGLHHVKVVFGRA